MSLHAVHHIPCYKRVCSCRQVMHARWEPILAIPSSPELGRGLCPAGGPQYAAVVFHYARTLALAAKAAGAQARGDGAGAAKLTADADLELALLQARRPQLEQRAQAGEAFWVCCHVGPASLARHGAWAPGPKLGPFRAGFRLSGTRRAACLLLCQWTLISC